jgi:hypothetical protein
MVKSIQMQGQGLGQETQKAKRNLIKMEFNGVMVAFRGSEEVSLTDLWRAAGSPENKDPYYWLRTEQAKDLINELNSEADTDKKRIDIRTSDDTKPISNRFVRTVKGGKPENRGTWACKELAVSYAGYLSAKLQLFVNRVFLERLQEERNPDLIAERFIQTHQRRGLSSKWINARFKAIQSNKDHNEVLSRHGVNGPGFAMCAHNINVGILGTTRKKYLTNRGLDPTENVRDYMSEAELTAETLAELLSDSKIEKEDINGNKPCAKVCYQVAKEIHETVNRIVN